MVAGDGDASVVRNSLRFFLNQALFLLSFFIPHRKGMVVIGSGLGKRFMGNPKYLYLRLLQQSNADSAGSDAFDVYWITENETLYKEFRSRNWPVLRKFSWSGFWSLLRAEFLVIESGMMATEVLHDVAYAWLFYGRFNVIQTWHGSPMKRICLDALRDRGLNTFVERVFFKAARAEYRSFDCVSAQSEYDQAVLCGAFANDNVAILGSARNDVFFNVIEPVQDLAARFHLDNYDRVLLYAPTYRESKAPVLNSKMFRHREEPVIPFSDEFLAQFNQLLSKRNWLLLVKKHHLDKALRIREELTHIVDVGAVDDIQELLVRTDLLITDYSSLCFDFVQADRPIIYYVYDLERYVSETRAFYIDYHKDIVGPFARTETELAQLVEDADSWFHDAGYRKRFLEYRRRFQKYSDGRASDRLIHYLRLRSSGSGAIEAGIHAERAV